jgi:hypothetical protein
LTTTDEDHAGARPEPHGNEPEGASYPLLFKGSSPTWRAGFWRRLLAFFRSPSAPGLPERGTPEDGLGEVIESLNSPDAATSSTDRSLPPGAPEVPVEPRLPAERSGPTSLSRATLQMLPGRLQPLGRSLDNQEIRFLRSTTRDYEVTVGREAADPPNHVTLDHPSLEPRHARMRYRDGHWWIESLLVDQAVRINDHAIYPQDGRRLLKNGDRVRMGDVEFRFLFP